MIAILLTLRLLEITNGIAGGQLVIDSTQALPVPAIGMTILDVTARPDMQIGCAYSGGAAPNQISTPAPGDTCTQPPPQKVIASTAIAAQLTAAEWTVLQTKIAAGDTTSAAAASTLLARPVLASAQAAVATLSTQGVITTLRATTINASLALSAVTP